MKKKTNSGAQVAHLPSPIATSGEIFADGTAIELVRQIGQPESVSLLRWDGMQGTVAAVVEDSGRFYAPAPINRSILHELVLPAHCSPHRSTRQLLGELENQAMQFVGLPEKLASIVGRAVLASWIIRALPVAPALSITGPNESRGNRLVQWLRCVCRHPLRMSEVTPGALCALPSGIEFTLLISQPTLSDKVQRLLDAAGRADQRIPHQGRLLDLYGMQVIHSESLLRGGWGSFRSVQIPVIPTNQQLATFDPNVQHRISAEFQPRLLGYRFANYSKALALQFDASRFTHSLRELAYSLAATTPEDADLQADVLELLKDEDIYIRSAKWVDFTTVVIESLVFARRQWAGEKKYVGDLAEVAHEIWKGRGVNTAVDPGAYGKRLQLLGFASEPRDAKGVRLHLTDDVCKRVEQLARDFSVPAVEDGGGEEAAVVVTKE